MLKVVKMFDNTQEMGYVKGLVWYNKNGATKKFQSNWQLQNYLTSYGLVVLH
jgi:hypothetical protein